MIEWFDARGNLPRAKFADAALCHPVPLTRVAVEFEIDRCTNAVHCTAQAEALGRTGVEMEALTTAREDAR